MKKYLPVEQRLIEILQENMSKGEKMLWIEGKTGVGKTFSIEGLAENFQASSILPVFFDSDFYNHTEYAPFLHGLSQPLYENNILENSIITESSELIPKIGKYIRKFLKILKSREKEKRTLRDYSLNEKEQDILCKMEYLSDKKELLFVCDHLNEWDENSLRLLYYIFENMDEKYDFLSNCIFIFVLSTDIKSREISFLNKLKRRKDMVFIEYPEFEVGDIQETLEILECPQSISTSEAEKLLSLSAGHIQLLIELIRELNFRHCTIEELNGSGRELLSEILTNRLQQCAVSGDKIQTALEYASLLGITFSQYELGKIVALDDMTFQEIIEHSKNLHLVHNRKGSPDILRFVHNIVHLVFQQAVRGKESNYYEKISTCMREIRPSEYSRRAKYARNLENVLSLTILNLIKQLRENGKIPSKALKSCQHLLKDAVRYEHYYKYLSSMKCAYELYNAGKFEEARKKLSLIDSIYPSELLAEREILCSCCYNKKIDSSFREEGIKRIEKFAELEKCNDEIDVYERVLLRLLILKIHVGKVEQAREIELKIVDSLKQRYPYDDDAKDLYHTLNRISNALYSCGIAESKMAKAVDYFGFDKIRGCLWRDIKKYYMALVNYGGVLCLNADYFKSFKVMEEAMNLFKQFQNYAFPRPNIMKNNYLIAGYFSRNLSINECKEGFLMMINDMPICAERLFFVSNYSIFVALSGNIRSALDVLEAEERVNPPISDKEFLYNYRVTVNKGIYEYLLGKKNESLIRLHQLEKDRKSIQRTNDMTLDDKRLTSFISLIEQSEQPCDAITWENILLENSPYQITPWSYYGKGFVFTTVFNWDIL